MNREQMIAWLTIEGYQACTGPELDWIYKVDGPWAFKWTTKYNGEAMFGSNEYRIADRLNQGEMDHLEMLRMYEAAAGWPRQDVLVTLVKILQEEGRFA